jgi:carotenoid cleavage dioxygenase-like enzyme
MVASFGSDPALNGYYLPFHAEMDAPDLIIEGALPAGLAGTFYRNGPDPQFPIHPQDRYHVFDGDGMIFAISIGGGKAALKNRWVRTPKFNAERAAGKRLFGVFGNPRFNEPEANMMDYSTANTHIWPHGDKLYALMEGCPPIAMDPHSLETLGSETFGGATAGPFTAHPKTCPDTGDMHAFGYSAKGPGSTAVRYNIIDAQGRPKHTTFLDQPYASMMHDFMMTDNYVIFPCLPVVIDLARAMAGKPVAAWETGRPSAFGIMPKGGTAADLRWVESDAKFMFHSANAFERGDEIVIDVAGAARAPLMPDIDGNLPTHDESRFAMRRWVIGKSGVTQETIDPLDVQFPRIDDRRQGRAYRAIYANGTARPTAGRVDGFDMLVRIDPETATRDSFDAGDGAYLGEPVFVADGSGESDGWLLSLKWDSQRNESALLVMNAGHLADGPVATIRMPARVPGGFHCHWRPAE